MINHIWMTIATYSRKQERGYLRKMTIRMFCDGENARRRGAGAISSAWGAGWRDMIFIDGGMAARAARHRDGGLRQHGLVSQAELFGPLPRHHCVGRRKLEGQVDLLPLPHSGSCDV